MLRAGRRGAALGCGRQRLGGLVEPGGLLRAQSFIRILLLLWWSRLGLRSCGSGPPWRRRRRGAAILRGALVYALRALLLDDGPPGNVLGGPGLVVSALDHLGLGPRSSRLGSGAASGSASGAGFPPAAASSGTRRAVTRGRSPAARARRGRGASGAGDGGFDASAYGEAARDPSRARPRARRATRGA